MFPASKKGRRRNNRCLKKINTQLENIRLEYPNSGVLIMFQDEAGFGRINTPKYCWTNGNRSCVPCHHIREYRYAFGAVDPISGQSFFLVMPYCNTACTNMFLSWKGDLKLVGGILLLRHNQMKNLLAEDKLHKQISYYLPDFPSAFSRLFAFHHDFFRRFC